MARARHATELQREIGRLAAAEALQRTRALEQRVERQAASMARLARRLEDLERHPVVRLLRRTRRVWARLRDGTAGRVTTSPRAVPFPSPDRGQDETAVAATGLALAVGMPADTTGPAVSVVVDVRRGTAHLGRTIAALASTTYRPSELVLVSDGPAPPVDGAFLPFRVHTLSLPATPGDPATRDAGVTASTSELVLFLDPAVEPLDPGWMGRLVQALAQGADAVGPRLVATRGDGSDSVMTRAMGGCGLTFRISDGAYLPVPLGSGGGAASASGVREVAALDSACLLVRRSALDRIGAPVATDGVVASTVVHGADLSLRLRQSGSRLLADERTSVRLRERPSTTGADAASPGSANTLQVARDADAAGSERLVATWGPRLARTALIDGLVGGPWIDAGLQFHVHPVHDTRGGSVAASIQAAGWRIVKDPADADIQVVVDPTLDPSTVARGGVLVAWLSDDAGAWARSAWLPDADVVLVPKEMPVDDLERRLGSRPVAVSGDPATAIRSAIRAWADVPHIAIHLEVDDWTSAALGGDLAFARDLQRALRRQHRPTRVRIRNEWTAATSAREDAAIALMGRLAGPDRPGQVNVLWQISHPDFASAEDYRRFDLTFAASAPLAALMTSRTGRPVGVLPQAADAGRFAPEATGPHHQLLFVANSRRVGRHLIRDLLPTEHALAVYGQRWQRDGLDPRYHAGAHVPNDDLPGYYASADIVLNDHWTDMRREGVLSNRLFDASAAGAFVISDEVEGLEETFDGGIVAYRDPADLRRLIDRFVDDPAARAAHAARARACVLAAHTFDHRATTLLAAIEPLVRERGLTVGPPA